jgi:menaquinone-dependent protoporphyrinogen oxidase
MRILVTAASKHEATTEIAETIGSVLREADHVVDVVPLDEVTSVSDYDAVVLGSAVYAGRWMDEAKRLAERHRRELAAIPLWLFSSGPIGDPPKPGEDPPDGARLLLELGGRGHQVFAGRLDRGRLNFVERSIVGVVKAPDGDYRDWEAIRAWAAGIAAALSRPREVVGAA